MTKVAVLGTGIMGAGVAHSLRRASHEVSVWNRTPQRASALEGDGIVAADDPREAVAGADVVMTTLYDTAAVREVMDELGPAWPDRAIWVQSATVGVDGTATLAAFAREHGITMVDAMMLGTKGPAEQGKLTLLVSGDRGLADRLDPVFDSIAAKVVWIGDEPGAGTALKLVCNAWIATITAAVGQSVALARALDLDPQLFLDAIDGSPTNSPYAQLKGGAMIAGNFDRQFAVDGVRKDVGLITAAATGAGLDATLLDAVHQVFDATSRIGHGDDDMAAVVTAYLRETDFGSAATTAAAP